MCVQGGTSSWQAWLLDSKLDMRARAWIPFSYSSGKGTATTTIGAANGPAVCTRSTHTHTHTQSRSHLQLAQEQRHAFVRGVPRQREVPAGRVDECGKQVQHHGGVVGQVGAPVAAGPSPTARPLVGRQARALCQCLCMQTGAGRSGSLQQSRPQRVGRQAPFLLCQCLCVHTGAGWLGRHCKVADSTVFGSILQHRIDVKLIPTNLFHRPGF